MPSCICRMREDMSTMVKEEEDPAEKLSQDEIISQTKQVIQGLEALKQEHHSILDGLLGTLRCLKQDEEGVLVEEKSHMIRKSLEMLELGLSEAQVGCVEHQQLFLTCCTINVFCENTFNVSTHFVAIEYAVSVI